MDANEDKIAEILRRLAGRTRGTAIRTNCPDEETLAIFLGGNLVEDARKGVEAHFATCSLCVEDLVAAHKAGQEYGTERVPQQLIDKAMALVRGKETLFDLVVRLVKDSIELISTSGRVALAPVPAGATRGEPKPSEGSLLHLEKEVGRFRVALELEVVEAGMCQVIAHVTENKGNPAEGIRLSLISGGREQASFLTREGEVVFDRVPLGEYSIAFFESGTPVGSIRLSLTS